MKVIKEYNKNHKKYNFAHSIFNFLINQCIKDIGYQYAF